jgi:hypothetical protein
MTSSAPAVTARSTRASVAAGVAGQEAFAVAGCGGLAAAGGPLETAMRDEHHASTGVDGELQRFGDACLIRFPDRLQAERLAVEVVRPAPVSDREADHNGFVGHGVLLMIGGLAGAWASSPPPTRPPPAWSWPPNDGTPCWTGPGATTPS